MERHVENAQKVAEYLSGRDEVESVNYAGLPDSPWHERATELFGGRGYGAIPSFVLKGGLEAGKPSSKHSSCTATSPTLATSASGDSSGVHHPLPAHRDEQATAGVPRPHPTQRRHRAHRRHHRRPRKGIRRRLDPAERCANAVGLRSEDRVAAVDDDGITGVVRRCRVGEEHAGGPHLVGISPPANGVRRRVASRNRSLASRTGPVR